MAGLSLLDEIAAIDGDALTAGQLSQRLARFAPGSKVELSIVRRGQKRTVNIVLATDPRHGWQLSLSPGATRAQQQRVDAWLQ